MVVQPLHLLSHLFGFLVSVICSNTSWSTCLLHLPWRLRRVLWHPMGS